MTLQRREFVEWQRSVAGRGKLIQFTGQTYECRAEQRRIAAMLTRDLIKAHLQTPMRLHTQLDRSAAESQTIQWVGPGDSRRDRLQRGRLVDRRHPLGKSVIRGAVHAHLAVGIRQTG